MKIALFGASSQIAKGLLREFLFEGIHQLYLFTRDVNTFQDWLNTNNFHDRNLSVDSLERFDTSVEFDLIINFIGIGDPAKALDMGSKIFDITFKHDHQVLDYLAINSQTKYIFISSGVVYGNIFSNPATQTSDSVISINALKHTDWYSMAKIYAEARHRALDHLSIVDIRVFNYISSDIDIDSRFLISDALRAISECKVMQTNKHNITRDYIGPQDLHQLIQKLANQDFLNISVDCFTKDPADKFSILEIMKAEFDLQYEVIDANSGLDAHGLRDNYFSENYLASSFGYNPEFTSLENIITASKDLLL
jgi:hypothetical protein